MLRSCVAAAAAKYLAENDVNTALSLTGAHCCHVAALWACLTTRQGACDWLKYGETWGTFECHLLQWYADVTILIHSFGSGRDIGMTASCWRNWQTEITSHSFFFLSGLSLLSSSTASWHFYCKPYCFHSCELTHSSVGASVAQRGTESSGALIEYFLHLMSLSPQWSSSLPSWALFLRCQIAGGVGGLGHWGRPGWKALRWKPFCMNSRNTNVLLGHTEKWLFAENNSVAEYVGMFVMTCGCCFWVFLC